MTIQEMFEREDIYSILEKTLKEYYKDVRHKAIEVHVSKKHFLKPLLIYPRLGIVVPRFPSWGVIRRTYVSFDVQNNLPKKLFAWAYVTLCFLTFGLLADASIELSDPNAVKRSTAIIPSNRKIRIYEYGEEYVDSILKVGFNDMYFKHEIEVREGTPFDFVLGLIDHGHRWYREKLLKGRCLVRCSGVEYDKYVNQTIEDLKLFYSSHMYTVNSSAYAGSLSEDYNRIIKEIEKTKGIKCGNKLRTVLQKMVSVCYEKSAIIPITLTHGDLQTGNIYIDEENSKLYIIDWETVKNKSIWYDAATMICSTRRKGKFSEMINRRKESAVQTDLLVFDELKNRDADLVAAILVLEEMGFFLDEIVDLPGDMGSEIIERFEYEIDHIDWKSFDEK